MTSRTRPPLSPPLIARGSANTTAGADAARESVVLALVLVVALIPSWPVLRAPDLVTGSGDWHAHLYRLHELAAHGLATWSHDWAGGLPLWSAYQFLPHVLTAVGTAVVGVDAARAMTAAQGLVTLTLPLSCYVVLRVAGLSRPAALAGASLTVALDGRRQATVNFTELWGLALAPALLWATWTSAGRRAGYAVAVAAGLAAEVHPLAAVTAAAGLLSAGLVTVPAGADARALARWACALVLRGALFAGGAAFFWYPAFRSARPAYEHEYFTSPAFERLLGRLAVASFAPGAWIWLGATAVAMVTLLCAPRVPLRLRRAAGYLLLVGVLIVAGTLVSVVGWGPRSLRDAQLPRLLSLLPLLAAAAGALMITTIAVRRTAPSAAAAHGTAGAALMLALILASMRTAIPSAPAGGDAGAGAAQAVVHWLRSGPADLPSAGERVAAPPEVVAEASALAPGHAWYTSSYSGQEWSLLAAPLGMFLADYGAPETLGAYLTMMAARTVVVPAGVRPALADPRTGERVDWEFVAALGAFDVLRTPWHPPYAFLTPPGTLTGLDAPDLEYWSVPEAYVRDEVTRRLAGLALGPAVVPATLTRATPTRIDLRVELPTGTPGELLITENWDTAWRARDGQGRRLPLRRAGPNLIAVNLSPLDGADTATVELVHGMPDAWRAGAAFVVAALLGSAVLTWRGPRAPSTERLE